MKKKVVSLVLVFMLVASLIVLTGCGENSNNSNNSGSSNNSSEQKSKGNYDVFESIKKIDPNSTLEEINKIIGFEGTVKSESDANSTSKWKLYRWDLTDDTAIEARIYDETKYVYLEAIYPNKMIENSKVDFSKANEMKTKINEKDGLNYDQVVEMLGGVQGTLDKRDSTTDTYVWRNDKGGSLTFRFSTSTGKCTSFNGVL